MTGDRSPVRAAILCGAVAMAFLYSWTETSAPLDISRIVTAVSYIVVVATVCISIWRDRA